MRRLINDEFLEGIARQYTEHVIAGQMPAPAIAISEGAPVATVHRWVREARKRGLLPPGMPPGLSGKSPKTRRLNTIGAAGKNVAANLRRLREDRRLTTEGLSDVLREAGQPIAATGITKVEKLLRRVDVDDLVALAAALRVTPAQLLEPPAKCATCHGTPPPGFTCNDCGAPS